MRNLNARRFTDPMQRQDAAHTIFSPASGESPVPRENSDAPPGQSAGRSCSIIQPASRPSIILAKTEHMKFVSALQKKFSNALGYLPTAALQWYVEQKRVGIAFENGEPAGYVLGRTHYKYQPLMRPITQAAVAMDAQRRHHGLGLVARVCEQAQATRQLAVQACCAADLDANEFWMVAGFVAVDVLKPDNARGREIIVWRKSLTARAPDWFMVPPPVAGHRAKKVIR
jgi:hypothetical protein